METIITLEELKKLNPDEYVYVDMRGEIPYAHGHIPGAVCWNPKESVERLPVDKKWVIYCSIGENSISVAEELQEQGFDAYSLKDGFRSWLLDYSEELKAEEIRRYDRQMILPEVGSEGQKKLKNASVLIIGAGGLGAPVALYLAGAGVGNIGIMDADNVNVSNLHRQIIHSTERVGINKAESAKTVMNQLNDMVNVQTYPYFLEPENAEEIIGKYDFIIDAADNFETKFLINDTCVLLKKPFCHAGILQFRGQVMTYVPGDFPCYRCIFEEIPEQGSIPNCSQAGVIGAMAGVIGCMQALEAIKYIIGAGDLLTGKMLTMDGLTMKIRIIDITNKNPSCRVCGEQKQITSIKDQAEEYRRSFCGF